MPSLPVSVRHAPRLTAVEAATIARDRYALDGSLESLPSERDQNFRIRCPGGAEYILKIANATERESVLDFEHAAMAHLSARTSAIAVPRVVPDRTGATIGRVRLASETGHFVRLLTWIPGQVLARTRPHSRELLASLGRALGEMDRAFEEFTHPEMGREFAWDLRRTPWIAGELSRFADAGRRALVERVVARFEEHVSPRAGGLRRQVIHDDWNDFNVITSARESRTAGGSQDSGFGIQDSVVLGAVDFGDLIESWTVADLAVACCYAMLGKPDPIAAAAVIAGGYHERNPLTGDELDVLLDLVRARLAISVTMCARQAAEVPDNEYLRISEAPAWDLLAALDVVAPSWAACAFRHACGLPASRTSAAVRDYLSARRGEFGPVVDEDLGGPVPVLDLGVGSLDIPDLGAVERIEQFCGLVNARTAAAGARAAIGRYDEARLVYVSDLFSHASNWDVENRTVHLGIDVFLPAGSPVRAPLDGIIHSVANNAGAGDYGPTVILQHETDQGVPFYTLYGHLAEDGDARSESRKPRAQSREPGSAGQEPKAESREPSSAGPEPRVESREPGVGRAVRRGETIGHLGDPTVNGGWPPHLHFQVITDMLDRRGDFPGVAAPSERAIWLDLCPDPNLVLGIPRDRFPAPLPDAGEILASRRAHLGPNLSVSYRRPLAIVRGHMQFLFDADGRRYLDAVNNVPHVGHSHPRVVSAAARQLSVLNTNSRYLHPLLASYAERLAALMPAPLSVCYIVCSGSEANELALRLACAYTDLRSGRTQTVAPRPAVHPSQNPQMWRDTPPTSQVWREASPSRGGVIVLDGAYHGNTTSLVEISPYKFDGPGGGGCPPHVRKAVMPDGFRGPHKAGDPLAGPKYAESVTSAARGLASGPAGLAAFFCESLLSCGGQIVLPDGYLAAAYAAVRAAGGVCVADEVQVGFGRVGTHLWGFETQGVVPDIVTLGKPIGNGFPLAAVVTRPEIAEAFDNGMEYFNTFGGSHAACAAGHAVLDVMRDEGLQARALAVGTRLKAGLEGLKDRFPIVGDVRGLGLFLGIELVGDRETLDPAAAQAGYVVNRLRDRGILVSTDGPLHNVIKIKPPLPFTDGDADRLVTTLADVLEEDHAQP